ncbi:MAG: hypothetical protein OWS74_02455, partial [Firmicutes bacterium]|nr:hypothetical protein [Bacillota bacterium]
RGVVTGASQFFRTIGGSFGVALMGTLLNHTILQQISRSSFASFRLSPSIVTESLLTPKAVPLHQAAIFRTWLNLGLHNSLLSLALCGLLIAVLVGLTAQKDSSVAGSDLQEAPSTGTSL